MSESTCVRFLALKERRPLRLKAASRDYCSSGVSTAGSAARIATANCAGCYSETQTLLAAGFFLSTRGFRLCLSQRFRCDFDRHSTRSEDPRTACIRVQTEVIIQAKLFWGRTGFDSSLEAQTACRGWFVGLVKNRTKQINADNEGLALAA
jgi:hypothetical protein